MSLPLIQFFTDDEIREAVSRQKLLVGEMVWGDDPTHSRYVAARFVVADEYGATIPGMTVELDYRRGPFAHDCKYNFTLFQLRGNGRRRVYQIEVSAPDRRSHNGEDGEIYGPHQHFGNRAEAIDEKGLGCADHQQWFQEFLRRANVGFGGAYVPPLTQGDLF